VPDEWLDVLAEAVAQRLGDAQPEQSSPWLTHRQLAELVARALELRDRERAA
jgi:hypothetical protein